MYRLALTDPRVKVPPSSTLRTEESFEKRVRWNAISGESNVPAVSARASHSGFALAVEMLCHARPSTPETGALSRFSDTL